MAKKRVAIDIVVPIVPKDHKFLPRLLREIQHSRRIPAQVIIAASSQSECSIAELRKIVERPNYDFQVLVAATASARLAGENRNVGWTKVTAPFVAFCDADDSYSWNRLYRVSELIKRYSPDLIIHSYSFQAPRIWLLFKSQKSKFARSEDLYSSTFPSGFRSRDLEIGEDGKTNLALPANFGPRARIHHAHTVVRSSTPIRFSSKVRCEDGVFCRDMVHQGFKVLYTKEKLSNYERPTISNISRRLHKQVRTFVTRVFSG